MTVQKVFAAMGTVHTVALEGAACLAAAERIRAMTTGLDRLWSVFREDSEIARLNRSAGKRTEQVSADTLRVIRESAALSAQTGGAFDVTAGALSGLWREAIRTGRLPDPARLSDAVRTVGAGRIRFFGDRVQLAEGQAVDLGGIAKGYALDRALELLQADGAARAFLNFGGTVGAIGNPIPIGVRNPFEPNGEPIGTVLLDNRCAVTSGSYERFVEIGGRRYHHIVDPRTGFPSDSGLASVTLIGTRATVLDALATGAFILGAEQSLPLLRRYGVEAIFVQTDGKVLRTEGVGDAFQLRANARTA